MLFESVTTTLSEADVEFELGVEAVTISSR